MNVLALLMPLTDESVDLEKVKNETYSRGLDKRRERYIQPNYPPRSILVASTGNQDRGSKLQGETEAVGVPGGVARSEVIAGMPKKM